jgi:hypothetical protein
MSINYGPELPLPIDPAELFQQKVQKFEELDQRVSYLVSRRENTWFFPNWRFGKSITLARIQRMKVGNDLIKDGADRDISQKIRTVFKQVITLFKNKHKTFIPNYEVQIRTINTRYANLNDLSTINAFNCPNYPPEHGKCIPPKFAHNFKKDISRNGKLPFTVEIGGTTYKVKAMGLDSKKRPKGTGAFGRVFEGRDVNTGKEVVIKVATPPPGQLLSDTLNLEARNLLKVYGLPHTVGCSKVAIDTKSRLMFAVMDKVDGAKELFDYTKKRKEIPFNKKIKILRQAAEALQACHNINFIHRDIKLENFLIDSKGKIHLIDLGFARHLVHDKARLKIFQGTATYIAPEVLLQTINQSKGTDTFSFGILMCELLAGMVPDQKRGQRRSQLFRNRLSRNGLSIGEQYYLKIDKRIPSDIVQIISKCLLKDPTKRPTMAQILDVLSGRSLIG